MALIEPLLKKCSSLSHIKQLQSHLIINGLFRFYPARSKLLDFCATSSSGSLSYAVTVFSHIPFPSTNDFNAVIRGHAGGNYPTEAVTCYLSMARASCKPDALTCSFALKACARALAYNEGLQIHSQVIRFGFFDDVLLQTTLLDVYAKTGDLGNAHKLFDEMSVRDIASWNALIAGLAQGSKPNEALELYKRMWFEGLKPNEVTVLGVLPACSQLGAIGEGNKVFEYVVNEKFDYNVQVCNAVIDMYAKCGLVERAYWVFDNMNCKKSLVTWNTMIMALAMQGDGVKALELFNKMSGFGVCPDSVSYLAALCACNHAGMVEDGVELFDKMIVCGIKPNVKHYGSVVDLLGRAGRLEEAYRIIDSMEIVPDAILWQTLLGASKTYSNIEMAEKASRKLIEMGSNDCGDFVLLSNTYASQERWKDVGRVRDAMKNQDVKKIPGFSYIEVKGVIHKFLNGDRSHPNWIEIYKKLDEVRFRVKEYGYVAETNYVLHDIGQEDKENALCYHSEKLAVAFGLINISNEKPIHVNKNLRICGDCHVMIKLISKIYKRDIIVRDRTRFHRFINGECSCKDYW